MLQQQEPLDTGPSQPDVSHFFHEGSSTLTYVVTCSDTGHCAIVDPVLDFDYASGSLTTTSADALIEHIRSRALTVDLILETHVHADHLTAAPYLQQHLGGKIAIGGMINTVQSTFAEIFDESEDFPVDGSQFDLRFADGDAFQVGDLTGTVMHVPGHTPACMAYLVGDALFVGDTLFMPDGGTARCDFPGGDAGALFRSIQRLLALPGDTRVFVCHDYQPNGRPIAFETTVHEQKAHNIHVHDGVSEAEFVAMREARDAELGMPDLIIPSLQVNMRAGLMPPKNAAGRLLFKVPINAFTDGPAPDLPHGR